VADILSIGSSGLAAFRKQLEVTGSNIVNASTDNYARRDTVMSPLGAGTAGPFARPTADGSGVIVDYVRRATNSLMQASVWNSTSADSQYQALSDGLNRLEKSVFTSASTVGTTLKGFFNSLQDLSANPTSSAARLSVFDAASQVVDQFHAQTKAIRDEVTSAEQNIDTALKQVNVLTAQLATLNAGLQQAGSGQQKAVDLLDHRDALLGQLTNLIGITVTEHPSGAVDVYLGESSSGPHLVSLSGSKDLASTKTGDQISIVYDPLVSRMTTKQLTSGAVAGVMALRDQALVTQDGFNRMALAFANAVNAQHGQGVDINGAPGLDMFATTGLAATASLLNSGSSKASVSITSNAAIRDDSYVASYDAATKMWTVTSQATNKSASGTNAVSIDGFEVAFEGAPADHDTYTIAPLKDAAAGMQFLLTDPTQIAASLARYADAGAANKGTATLDLTQLKSRVDAPDLPQLQDVFSQALTPQGALGVKRDGVVAMIPSGAADVQLASIAQPSTANFALTPTDIAAINGQPLSITLDGTAIALTIKVSSTIGSMKPQDALDAIARAVNSALNDAGYADSISASSTDGGLTLTALGGAQHRLTAAALGSTQVLSATVSSGATAADMRVFTRDGVQLAGPPLSNAEISSFLTEANGFTADAARNYSPTPPGFPVTYRGLTVTSVTSPLSVKTNATQTDMLVSAMPETDIIQTLPDGTQASGTRYSAVIPGLAAVTVNGREVMSQSAESAATALFNRINQQATQRSLSGAAVNWAALPAKASFSVSVDGQSNQVTFRRDTDASGVLQNSGTFSVSGPSGLGVTLNSTTGALAITLPKSFSQSVPTIEMSGPDAAAFGVAGATTTTLGAANAVDPAVLAAGKTISIRQNGVDYDVAISGASGTDAKTGLSWSLDSQGRLQLASSDPSLALVAGTLDQRDAAQALGFARPDLTLTQAGDTLSMTSSVRYQLKASQLSDTATLAKGPINLAVNVHGKSVTLKIEGTSGTDTANGLSWAIDGTGSFSISSTDPAVFVDTASADNALAAQTLGFAGTDVNTVTSGTQTVSGPQPAIDVSGSGFANVGQSIVLAGRTDEDLIVSALSTGGPRNLVARYPQGLTRAAPLVPNIRVEVTAGNTLKIYDITDKNDPPRALATRSFTVGVPVDYLGLKFEINGSVNVGDTFSIIEDRNRSGDNRNALLLAKLQSAEAFGANNGTFQDAYAAAAAKLGSSAQVAKLTAQSTSSNASDLKSQYAAATGVNLDTEAADLLRFQQAYQAAAQVVSVARDLFNAILGIRNG
jgi:flagellar hook-associated protein 1 FlgK